MKSKKILIIDTGYKKDWLIDGESWIALGEDLIYSSDDPTKEREPCLVAYSPDIWSGECNNCPLTTTQDDLVVLLHRGQGQLIGYDNSEYLPAELSKAKDYLHKLIPFSHGKGSEDSSRMVGDFLSELAKAMKNRDTKLSKFYCKQLEEAVNNVKFIGDFNKKIEHEFTHDDNLQNAEQVTKDFVTEQKKRAEQLAAFLRPAASLGLLREKISQELLIFRLSAEEGKNAHNFDKLKKYFYKNGDELGFTNIVELCITNLDEKSKLQIDEKLKVIKENLPVNGEFSNKIKSDNCKENIKNVMKAIDDIVFVFTGK